MRKVHSSSTGTWLATKPQAASAMMAISRFFTKRIIRVLSYFVGELTRGGREQQNGRMNSAPITSPAMAGGSHDTLSW